MILWLPPTQVAWATRPGEPLAWAMVFQAFGLNGEASGAETPKN